MIYVLLAYISYPFVFLMTRLGSRPSRLSFVVFQTAKLGDMICTTPVFREIKKAHPASRLAVVIHPSTRPLLRHNPHVDEMIDFDAGLYGGLLGKLRFAGVLRKRGYSSALILMPNSANILGALWALIPVRVSICPDYAGATLRQLLRLNTRLERHGEGRMSSDTYLAALAHFGIKWRENRREVFAAEGADKKASAFLKPPGPFAGIAPGTANVMKDWGRERFVELSKRIADSGLAAVVVIGSEKEAPIGEEIAAATGKGRVINACGRFTLEELPELLKRLSVVVGVDTALVYMADAQGVGVVDIAGPCDMCDQRPIGRDSVIIRNKDLSCAPCSHTFRVPYECRHSHRRCVTEITVEEVFLAVKKILKPHGVLTGIK